jgi:hypothetical protein
MHQYKSCWPALSELYVLTNWKMCLLERNIPTTPAYGVYISRFIRYDRAFYSHVDCPCVATSVLVVLLDKHPKLVEMKIIPHCRNIFQNPIEKWEKESHSLSITHKYMTPHFPGLEQALQWKVPGLNSCLSSKTTCDHHLIHVVSIGNWLQEQLLYWCMVYYTNVRRVWSFSNESAPVYVWKP